MTTTPTCATTAPPDQATAFGPGVERVERVLHAIMPAARAEPEPLHQAMRHALFAGGKRLRPLLVYATGATVGAAEKVLDPPACAVELIHTYSLIHDDLPAMDDDDLRRGQPTCHVVYGEALAILAGDALQALAFETLANAPEPDVDAATRLRMLQCLGAACGSGGMAGGQAMDLDAVGRQMPLSALERMHALKTGALIRASVRLGALAAGCRDHARLDALDRFAATLGLAFQVRDDILDVEGNSATLGKTAGKDAHQAKPTFPSTIGLDASRQRLDELIGQALDSIADLGHRAEPLRQLARYAARRTR